MVELSPISPVYLGSIPVTAEWFKSPYVLFPFPYELSIRGNIHAAASCQEKQDKHHKTPHLLFYIPGVRPTPPESVTIINKDMKIPIARKRKVFIKPRHDNKYRYDKAQST